MYPLMDYGLEISYITGTLPLQEALFVPLGPQLPQRVEPFWRAGEGIQNAPRGGGEAEEG